MPTEQAGVSARDPTDANALVSGGWCWHEQSAPEIITDRIFPFDQIADAFAYLGQGRAHGKVVVQMV